MSARNQQIYSNRNVKSAILLPMIAGRVLRRSTRRLLEIIIAFCGVFFIPLFSIALSSCSQTSSTTSGGDGIPIEGVRSGTKSYEFQIATTSHNIGISFKDSNNRRIAEISEKTTGLLQTEVTVDQTSHSTNIVLESAAATGVAAGTEFHAEFADLVAGEGALASASKFAARVNKASVHIDENYLSAATLPAGVGVLAFSCNGKEQASYFAGGDGSEAGPYLICSLVQLKNIGTNFVNRNFRIMANINMTDASLLPHGWDPVGTEALPFTGTIDGQGKTLSNLTIPWSTRFDVGLLGVAKNVKVRNLNFSNVSVGGYRFIGTLIGRAIDSLEISNVHVTSGTITADSFAGGLLGYISSPNQTFGPCTYLISESSTALRLELKDQVGGGLVGQTTCWDPNSRISKSHSTGDIVPTGTDVARIGGLVGQSFQGTIEKSWSSGNISARAEAAGLVGFAWGMTIKNSYSLTNVTSTGSVAAGAIALMMNGNYLENVYTSGTITSNWTHASGLVGSASGTNPIVNIKNSFTTATLVNTLDATHVSGVMITPLIEGTERIFSNNWWINTNGGAPDCIQGAGVITGCSAAAASVFSNPANEPLASWDFSANGIWEMVGPLPTLK